MQKTLGISTTPEKGRDKEKKKSSSKRDANWKAISNQPCQATPKHARGRANSRRKIWGMLESYQPTLRGNRKKIARVSKKKRAHPKGTAKRELGIEMKEAPPNPTTWK